MKYKECPVMYLGWSAGARPMTSGKCGDPCTTRTDVAQWVREVKESGNVPRVLRSGRAWFTRDPRSLYAWLDWAEE